MDEQAASFTRCDAPEIADQARKDFARIVQSHRPQIFRFLLSSLRDPDAAETLTQECFLKAYRNWSRFRGDASVLTWLIRIAINLQRDYWRSRRMRFWHQTRANSVELMEASDWLASREASPETRLAAREQIAVVWRTVDTLTPKQRTVFLLHFVEELKLSEITEATGMREGTVKAHLFRAIKNIRGVLGKERSVQNARIGGT